MATTTTWVHDPEADLDYGCDWSDWLGADTIATSTWTVTPSGPTLSGGTNDTTSTTIWVDGGTEGVTYSLTNHIITAAGREDDRTLSLVCRHR